MGRTRSIASVAACGLAIVGAVGAVRAAPPIVTTDLLRLRSVSSIDVAWDGSRTVVAVRSIGRSAPVNAGAAPRLANRSHLFLLETGGPRETTRQLTFGDRNDHAPVLSPDGRRIAFVRGGVSEDEPPQVWVMPVDGGEARPVTAFERGAGAPAWSPDGRRLLVTSSVPATSLPDPAPWASERPGGTWCEDSPGTDATGRPDGTREEIRVWLAENARERDPDVITRLNFQDETALRAPASFRQLFLVDPAGSGAAPRRLTDTHRDHRSAAFLSAGDRVIFSAKNVSERHPDRVLEHGIWSVDLDGGEELLVLEVEGWSLRRPRPGADGSVIAFVGHRTDQPVFRPRQLGLASLGPEGASPPIWLTDESALDLSVGAMDWLPARSALVFTAAQRGGFPLLTMGLGLLQPAVLVESADGLPVGVHTFGAGGGTIVYAQTSAANPCTLRVRDARGDRLILDLNEWTGHVELAKPVPGRVTRPDGTVVDYWLMEPTRRDPMQMYPLAVEIHGGPSGMWGPGEPTMWHEFQLLCSWGYAVVYANPRGSGGYGTAFRRANDRDWGDGPGGDVLAVVDAVLLEGWIDPERMVVTGGSYGGYLTAWIIAHDHRFKAAVAQRGVYDLRTFFGEGNAWRLVEFAMGGLPWDPRVAPILRRESPFSTVNRIRTPLLIIHGSADLRTGLSQSEMLYRGLKRLGRPVEYVRYPAAGHDLSRTGDPRQRLDRLARIIEFFERAIENPRPAPVAE